MREYIEFHGRRHPLQVDRRGYWCLLHAPGRGPLGGGPCSERRPECHRLDVTERVGRRNAPGGGFRALARGWVGIGFVEPQRVLRLARFGRYNRISRNINGSLVQQLQVPLVLWA